MQSDRRPVCLDHVEISILDIIEEALVAKVQRSIDAFSILTFRHSFFVNMYDRYEVKQRVPNVLSKHVFRLAITFAGAIEKR